ncbi:MAG TPA: protein-disulfide isomerase [Candidatus Paceibacterota bacterium]
MKSHIVLICVLVAVLLVVAALGLKWPFTQENAGDAPQSSIGKAGSEHSHSSMLVFIRGELFDFSKPEYQLKSPLVHFEDDDGTTVHKHATGITLPYLFETLGMKLTLDCLEMPGRSYCTQGNEALKIFVNQVPFNSKIVGYELRPGDKILINYGSDSDFDLKLKLNSVPNLPNDL